MNKIVNSTQKEIAKRFLEAREKADYSQGALAEAMGVERKTINRIENGHFSPNLETLVRLCEALNTKLSVFLKGM